MEGDTSVPTVGGCDASALLRSMLLNRPAVAAVNSAGWNISQRYILEDGTLDVTAFKDEFGDCIIPVDIDSASYSSSRTNMPIRQAIGRMVDGECLYGKDWHFLHAQGCSVNTVPPVQLFEAPAAVREDWLNWYSDIREGDDYRFIYIGGPKTRTGLHYDVLNSYSWSVNICGRKLWKFWNPSLVEGPDVESEEALVARGVDPTYTFVQQANEMVYVPSGWHHTVVNLGVNNSPTGKITLSMNHNWINGFNIYRVWRFILQELRSVHKEIGCFLRLPHHSQDATLMDEIEWNKHCETLMRANCSFSVLQFFEMVCGRLLYYMYEESKRLPHATDFTVPRWAYLFCNNIYEKILSAECCDLWYIQSCDVNFAGIDNEEDESTVKGVMDDFIPCPNVSREEVLKCLKIESTYLFEISIPRFGLLEICRVLEECSNCHPLLNHLNINIPLTAAQQSRSTDHVQESIRDMIKCSANYLHNC